MLSQTNCDAKLNRSRVLVFKILKYTNIMVAFFKMQPGKVPELFRSSEFRSSEFEPSFQKQLAGQLGFFYPGLTPFL